MPCLDDHLAGASLAFSAYIAELRGQHRAAEGSYILDEAAASPRTVTFDRQRPRGGRVSGGPSLIGVVVRRARERMIHT
jgi:hypothetical protein